MAGEIAGFRADLLLSTSTSGTPADLAKLKNFSLNAAMSPIDISNFDSAGDKEFIPGWGEWDGTAEVVYVSTDATHKAVFDVLAGRTKVSAEFFPTGSSSDGYYSGTCMMTNWNPSAPQEDALGLSVAFKGTGVLTRSSSST